jgi:hypothetical protein
MHRFRSSAVGHHENGESRRSLSQFMTLQVLGGVNEFLKSNAQNSNPLPWKLVIRRVSAAKGK